MTRPEQLRSYREGTQDSFAVDAVKAFAVVSEDRYGTLTVHGPCPRCGHLIDITIPQQLVTRLPPLDPGTGSSAGSATNPPATSTSPEVGPDVPVRCGCREPHPDRPTGIDDGCGAYWNFTIITPKL